MGRRPIPDLTFPSVALGKRETPWDLRRLLYVGGAKANVVTANVSIDSGKLGAPLQQRIELVTRLHENLTARLAGGTSKHSAFKSINCLRTFFAWVDQWKPAELSLESVEDCYCHWADSLLIRVRLGEVKQITSYGHAATVSYLLDDVLERTSPLIRKTRIRHPGLRVRAAGSVESDAINLANASEFGHLLLDIIDGLDDKAIFGPLPVRIPLRNGTHLEFWCGLRSPKGVLALKKGYDQRWNVARVKATRHARDSERTLRTRSSVANLRMEAEFLVFVSQTGMNFTQANNLKVTQFSYKSTIDGYQVRDFKRRRQGEVLFEIYAEYRAVFERYLAWRNQHFPDSLQLFPFICSGGRAPNTPRTMSRLHRICKQVGVQIVLPRQLRKLRINWLLRRSKDPQLTADQAQHTKETLLKVYDQPSQQVAMVEIIQFWPEHDPVLRGDRLSSTAPGICDGQPVAVSNRSPQAPEPDCVNPSGCLFCAHHRDIDSADYLWSVASMRHLKTIVLQSYRPKKPKKEDAARPVELAIQALTAKLQWFQNSNERRKKWAAEAVERIEEGDFHPHWRYLIESAIGV